MKGLPFRRLAHDKNMAEEIYIDWMLVLRGACCCWSVFRPQWKDQPISLEPWKSRPQAFIKGRDKS